jgi:cation diffusion facilitator CzcD-associated flavoprotein CzcO
VHTGADVSGIERTPAGWVLRTADGRRLDTRAIICATGIVSNPIFPAIDGSAAFRGKMIHSVEYRRPEPFAGQRVLVVGAGNSAGDIAVEIASAGGHVTIAVRSGARVVPRELLGVPSQYFAAAFGMLPRPFDRLLTELAATVAAGRGKHVLPLPPADGCRNVPLIGHHLVAAIRAGTIRLEGGVAAFGARSARFTSGGELPFDVVIMATGYRAALRPMEHLIRTDRCGFAVRHGPVASADQAGLYFVGHNYDTRGGLRNIAHDARLASKLIARSLAAAG